MKVVLSFLAVIVASVSPGADGRRSSRKVVAIGEEDEVEEEEEEEVVVVVVAPKFILAELPELCSLS